MHYLLYAIALAAILIGIGVGAYNQNMLIMGNGLLVGVLFGALAKGLHLLDQIEDHLRIGLITSRLREERREMLERYPSQLTKRIEKKDTEIPNSKAKSLLKKRSEKTHSSTSKNQLKSHTSD